MAKFKIELYKYYRQLASRKKIISFCESSLDDYSLSLCLKSMKTIIYNLLRAEDLSLFNYTSPQGLLKLRENIISNYKLNLSPDHILITDGAQHALNLTLTTFLKPNDRILINPQNYLGIEIPIKNARAKIVTFSQNIPNLPRDAIAKTIKKTLPKLLYICPDFYTKFDSYPKETIDTILKLAQNLRFYIVQDLVYRHLGNNPNIPLFPPENPFVITCNSISKLISPGLRIGWIITKNKKKYQNLLLKKESQNVSSSTLNQTITTQTLRYFPKLLPKIQKHYQKKTRIAIKSLKKNLPKNFTIGSDNDFFIWITGPKNFNSKNALTQALVNGVSYIPGEIFSYSKPHGNVLRLSIGSIPSELIEKGILRLAKTLQGKNNLPRLERKLLRKLDKRIKKLFS